MSETRPVLEPEQIERFIRDGYIIVSGLIPPDVLESTRATMWEALKMSPNDPATWPEKSIIVPHEVNPLMKPCRTPGLDAVSEQLAGPHFYRRGGFSPVLNFPREGPQVFEPLGCHIDGLEETMVWPVKRYLVHLVYLTDTTEYGGALAVQPGSHRLVFEHWVTTGGRPNGSTPPSGLPYADPIPVPGRAGDVVFMHYLLCHASSRNRSSHVREALNGTAHPDEDFPYVRKSGPPDSSWTPLDRTLRTDTLEIEDAGG